MTTKLPVTPNRQDIITPEDADWLDQLTENITAIIIEAGFNIRQAKIRMYWDIGREIIAEQQRQLAAYEEDQELPLYQQTRDPPASRAFIARHIGDRLQQYEGLIGTGRTALYDAANFAQLCPTEEILEETLQKLEAGKNATWRHICHKLLPGHEDDQPPLPVVFYNGQATLFYSIHKGWCATLPVNTELDAYDGDIVHVVIKEIS
jgi:hypothetical protein